MGLSPTKKIRICVKVLTDNNGNSQVTPLTIRQNIERTISVYKQCNIEVIITGIDYIVKPQYLTTTCTPLNIFSLWHAWFTQTACGCCNQVTVFFVDELLPTNVSGYTIWGDNWCRVDAGASGDDTTMAHEIGHILNLWHVTDPNNLMYAYYSSTAHNLTTFQCCFIRQSPFITSY